VKSFETFSGIISAISLEGPFITAVLILPINSPILFLLEGVAHLKAFLLPI